MFYRYMIGKYWGSRECIRKWHKMQPGRELSEVQQDYLVDVIMTWIQKEMDQHEIKEHFDYRR